MTFISNTAKGCTQDDTPARWVAISECIVVDVRLRVAEGTTDPVLPTTSLKKSIVKGVANTRILTAQLVAITITSPHFKSEELEPTPGGV